ncbi:MAG: tetratricopeptide repeat protein [Prevotellaceae bacterium]|jgi:tetratricopeptide (TPR) repeat protein|nr:tetratricopeptide repeat protein [Prevotellaceae bacterium]
MSKNIKKEKENIKAVGEALSKGEKFLTENKTAIIRIITFVVVVTVAIFAYVYLIEKPRANTAQEQLFAAQRYFEIDSFNLALNGDGINFGFYEIIDEYGSTKAGRIARFYAGFCNLHSGNYEDAIDMLKEFNGQDELLQARAYCGIGDAYVELEQYDDAIEYFMKAANYRENDFSAAYLMKAGLTYEQLGKYAEALEVYEKIKTHYSKTIEAQEIDKYIERAKIKQTE